MPMVNHTGDPLHQLIIFTLLVILMVPSILCSLYLFYQFVRLRVLRTRITNHLVLLLLIIDFIQVDQRFQLLSTRNLSTSICM